MNTRIHGYFTFESYLKAVDVALDIELGKTHKQVADFDWLDYYAKKDTVEFAVHEFLHKLQRDKVKHNDLSFSEFMAEVDEYLEVQCNMESEDLPDFDWNDLWVDKIPAEEAADMFLDKNELVIGIIETIELIEQEKENV
jgi:hypothetical protein